MSRFEGYDRRSKQPCLPLSHRFQPNGAEGIASIDDWLRNRFNADLKSLTSLRAGRVRERLAFARAHCEYILLLYGELLRACGLPSYELGKIVHLAPVAGTSDFDVGLLLPVVDNIPRKFFSDLFVDAARLIDGPLSAIPSEVAVQKVFSETERLIEATKRWVPFVGSVLPICRLAAVADRPFRHLGNGVLQFGWGVNSTLSYHSAFQADSAIGAALAADKRKTAALLQLAGFPVPEHAEVANREAAIAAADRLGWPVVVKPVDRERSVGVTIEILSEADLSPAFERARAESQRVLVERHIPGVCHRIMVADGQVVYAVRRNPKGVIGDGKSTVRQLIADANATQALLPPWQRLTIAPADDVSVLMLKRAGLTMDTVLKVGQLAPLRPFNSVDWGGVVDDVLRTIHPENAKLAVDAAQLLGLAFAGVDMISTDISVPWYENGGVINEVNYRPEFSAVAREIWDEGILPLLAHGDGRVPVHVVVGEGDLGKEAKSVVEDLRKDGRRCYLTGANYSEDGEGNPLHLASTSAFDRSIALLMRRDLKELMIVDEHQEFFSGGFPVDRLADVYVFHPHRESRSRIVRQIESRIATRTCRAKEPSHKS